ncbi:hypothetical protein L9F63_002851 [Diploptera punctata]|uniref:NUDE domain-containing protein n=1 Tax=Diploptera punctata TaxID=6984 RepID=A0AAD7ZR28_DIPPU|nr:hypothetical protein L9F63_002851 [Diploptera punctata]
MTSDILAIDQDIPTFSSKDEEVQYWKDLATQLHQELEYARDETKQVERELEEFQENSQQLEKELETQLEQSDKTIRELRTRSNRLQLDYETLKESFEQTKRQNTSQISELQSTVTEYQNHEKKLLEYIRQLEQKNDDLERSHRAMMTSVAEFEAKLNSAIERNALLESEQDEAHAVVQRLKDEARDLKQEMKIRSRDVPDNDKCLERVRSPMDSNKLKVEMETQTAVPGSPLKMSQSGCGQNIPLTPPARISAMNIVGDLLRKALESKLATCRNTSRESLQSGDTPTRDTYRGRRLNRGTSSPSIHGYLRA